MAKGDPDEAEVYSVTRHIFYAKNVPPHKKKIIACIKAHEHEPDVKSLILKYGEKRVSRVVGNVSRKGVFLPSPKVSPVAEVAQPTLTPEIIDECDG
ncbi:hypothetical protein MRB53_038337 [Persea americana]|nr:hypothetical protein MRB53_038337 [Persea americana]